MIKFYLNKIISLLIMFAFIYYIYDFIQNSSLSFDSIENTQDFLIQNSNNSVPSGPEISDNDNKNINEDNTHNIHTPILTFYDKIRRKLHWELYGHNNSPTINEFNKTWKPTDSIKAKFKSEFKDFKHNPIRYFKQDYSKTREVIIKKNDIMKELERKNYYVDGEGWLTREKLRSLNAKGYIVKDSKIVKISK